MFNKIICNLNDLPYDFIPNVQFTIYVYAQSYFCPYCELGHDCPSTGDKKKIIIIICRILADANNPRRLSNIP